MSADATFAVDDTVDTPAGAGVVEEVVVDAGSRPQLLRVKLADGTKINYFATSLTRVEG